MELTLREEDAVNWVYRGEGAVNLVLAYNGSNPSFVGKVMRIRKAPKNSKHGLKSTITVTAHELLLWKDVNELVSSSEKDIIDQLYVEHVMMPLLGSKCMFWCLGNSLNQLRRLLLANVLCGESMLPRLINNVILVFLCLIILCSLMPKWGFLPQSRFVSEGNAIKTRVTRFEMHQALKLHQGAISELSQYNPLDLFSGSKERIRKAIKDLFITPQNNFRVFLNGVLILGGLGGGTRKTDSHLAEAFEERLKSVIEADKGHCTENLFTLVAETMHKSRVLDQLLEVQKLDNFDIEGAIHAYYNVISQPCMACRELNEEQAKQYKSFHSASLDESLRIVKNYLIAATAKDCSLMICFRQRTKEDSSSIYNNIYLESTKQAFDFKVYFIDLDLKRLNKMEEYYELDKKIVSCYKQSMNMDHQERNEVINKMDQEVTNVQGTS
ncbi:inositol-pentakisphosphate 2-kinase isoform X3 [Arachis ipaensis]|uniref:inositol-pentakisphosphate 2-kinase isoform X3 n=1 Tax=Arachis ipaensis TaxID=130454 RepID=UPI000A2B95E5|nr:inositol-pentakisphosphate 2-kinase isoform X3 [Arachis ipaensis]